MAEISIESTGLDASGRRMRADEEGESLVKIPVDKIRPNPFQPRRFFDKNALEELAGSIRQDGLNEPIIVRRVNDEHSGFLFELIAGERRWRAVKLLGEQTIDALVKDYDDHRTKRLGLVENIQRENLNTIEIAYGIKALRDDYADESGIRSGAGDEKSAVEAIAGEIGKDRKTVERYLRIHEGIIAVPEVEALFRMYSDRVSFRDAKEYAAVAYKLRALKKSNNREHGRIIKKLTKGFSDKEDKDGIKNAIGYLHKYFDKEKKSASEGMTAGREFFFETAEKFVLHIEIPKDRGLDPGDIAHMVEACRQCIIKARACSSRDA